MSRWIFHGKIEAPTRKVLIVELQNMLLRIKEGDDSACFRNADEGAESYFGIQKTNVVSNRMVDDE